MHNTNKERKSLESMDQTQTTRFVSRFEQRALRSRLHHREGFPLYPPRKLQRSTEDRSTELHQLQEVYRRPEYRTPTNPILYRRGISTQEGGLQQSDISQPQINFPTNKDPIERIE